MTSRITTALASRAPSASNGPRLTRIALALTTALTPVWGAADTLPTGGSVVHGTATIGAPNAGAMTIDQSSDRAVVNWDAFSIGTGNRVTINQPSADAAILNRVTGDTTSQIHGQLNANGRVFVVNPNGIFIGATGSVNTGSFVASTLGIRTDDFALGNTVFEGDGSSATVSNAGNIEVVTGGYAALIGGQVSNSGTIQAPMGFVGLGSGERITLDLGGDGFMQVAIPTDSDDPALQALIENSGTIQANGGTVQLSAATARTAARHAINMSGVVEARTVSGRNGRITLGGGGGGSVSVTGTMRTSARRPAIQVTQSARPALRPARGGDVTITAQNITLEGAQIDASGADGGGNIRIGGAFQGAPDLPTADTLTVDAATNITAAALTNGNGGRVILWSDIHTSYNGAVSVQGGTESGDGGFVEVSGKQNLSFAGLVDASAPHGDTGTLLLDPTDIEIVAAAPGLNQILNTDIQTALGSANVVVSTDLVGDFTFPDASEPGDININAPITWATANELRFNADRDIFVNAPITAGTLGGLVLDGLRDVTVDANLNTDNADLTIFSRRDLTINPGAVLSGFQGTITLGGVAFPPTDLTMSGTINANGSNMVFQAAGGDVLIDGTINAQASLNVDADNITVSGTIDGNNSTFFFNATNDFTLDSTGVISGDDALVGLDASNAMAIDGTISLPSVNFNVDSLVISNLGSGPISASGTTSIDVGLFRLSAGDWDQVSAALGTFDADNFVIDPGSSFLRVTGGDGSSTPYSLVDVYGLQGVGTLSGSDFTLATDIDASPTSTWIALPGDEAPVTGLRDAGFVPLDLSGTLDGQGNTISNLFVRRFAGTSAPDDAGLFATNNGTISNLTFNNADVAGPQAGVVAAINGIVVDGVSVENSSVTAYVEDGGEHFAGGIAGQNFERISNSRAVNVTVSDTQDPSLVGVNLADDLYVGGITGGNNGSIFEVQSSGSVSYNDVEFAGRVGGIAGTNTANSNITDSYSTAAVSANTTAGDPGGSAADVGSIAGANSGTLTRVLANGPVSQVGPNPLGDVGAVTGFDDAAATSIVASYFNPGTTGQAASGQDGEVDAGGLIVFQGARARTTAELNDAAAFDTDAGAAGWDFTSEWGLPQDGTDHARLFTTDPVINAFEISPSAPEFEYNSTTDNHTAPNTLYVGGPTVYRFGPFGDAGDLTVMDDEIVLSDANVGAVTFSFPTSFTSNLLQNFDVRSLDQPATVTAAPLSIIIDPATKEFGDTLSFADVSFVDSILLGTDRITSATVVSAGAPANAAIGGSPYTLDLAAFVGPGLTNYNIVTTPSTLTVTPRALTVSVNNLNKTYGDLLVFNGTEFSTSGLIGTDSITSLSISSAGAAQTATVAGGPYAVNGSGPVGSGLTNYTITIVPGSLNVSPRPADITVPSISKVYGDTVVLNNSNFSVTGLVNGDTITSLDLSSAGTPATAPVADSPFAITASNPGGSGADNYTLNVTTGTITVTPAPLTVTADDQNKNSGTEFVFDGTEFTVTGLLNADEVTSATFTSAATDAEAGVTGPGGVAILITDAQGSGLDNYEITLVNGIFIVAPGDLIITANDLTKTYGSELVFDGTEFSVAGLAEGDSVDSITLFSAGAADTIASAGSTFDIVGSAAVGTGLDKYTLVFADGTLTVVPAPLTVSALDLTKQQGQTLTFDGSEFSASGLLNGDTVTNVALSSLGAAADAQAEDSPFVISVGDVIGTGLANYNIATVDGQLTVQNLVNPPITNPITPGNATLPNPPDTLSIGFSSSASPFAPSGRRSSGSTSPGTNEAAAGPQQRSGNTAGGTQQSAGEAQQTLAVVEDVSGDIEIAIQSCGNADQDFSNYMACLSESLNTYANALDQITNDLPSGFENVSAVIQQARVGVDAAAARAQRRLAGATSEAQRSAIRADAINEARGAINEAQTEIRKAISLIRADDPDIAAVQRQTGARIIQAFDTIDGDLLRAVEL